MALVIKGTTCAGARRIAAHLSRTDTNERVVVKEIRGVVAGDLVGALREMEAVAAGARTTRPFYHASINPESGERMTDEQRAYAIDKLEARIGLTGQPRVVVLHEKKDREHCHIVWSRIDTDRMAAISDSHNYRKHEEIARALEREFGFKRVQGAHIERDGKERPKRTPSHAEMLQADRTGLTTADVAEQLTELWRKTDNGPDFAMALWRAGYVLARGDQRDFVVIDRVGGTHSLSRRIEGATAKDVRERLADLDPKRFPSVVDAKRIQRARQERDAARSKEGPEVERDAHRESPRPAAQANQGRSRGTPEGPAGPVRAADGVGRAASTLLDGFASLFERGIFGGESKEDQVKQDREAEPEPDPKEAQHEAVVRDDQEQQTKRQQQPVLRWEPSEDIDHDLDRSHTGERGRTRSR